MDEKEMLFRKRRWLKVLAVLSGIILLGGILVTPFLPLSPFGHQLMVGIVLTGYPLALLVKAFLSPRPRRALRSGDSKRRRYRIK